MLTQAGLKDLKAAGYVCIQVNGLFADVQFRVSDGFGIEDIGGDMQLMVLKAALGQTYFSDSLGKLMANALKQKVADVEKRATPNGRGNAND